MGTASANAGLGQCAQGLLDVGVVAEGRHHRHAHRIAHRRATGNQQAGVHQGAGRCAFIQPLRLQPAGARGQLDQLPRGGGIDTAFVPKVRQSISRA